MSTSLDARPATFPPIPAQGGLGVRPASAAPTAEAVAAAQATGYATGWAQGMADAARAERATVAQLTAAAAEQRAALAAQVAGALAALHAAAQSMRERTVPAVDAVVDTLAASAIDLAEAVLAAEVPALGERAHLALRRALAVAPEDEAVEVRLHPSDHSVLADVLAGDEEAAVMTLGRRGVQIVADPTLALGEAVADFDGGQVDARIGTALDRMRGALRSPARRGAAGSSPAASSPAASSTARMSGDLA